MFDEMKQLTNFLDWLKGAKLAGIDLMEKTDSKSYSSKVTFSDEKYPEHRFELTIKTRLKTDEE